jgi:signal transduction histidine kinase
MVNALDRRGLTLTCAVIAAVYFLAGKLGLTLAFVNASATAVWPPAGIALAAFLVLGYRVWPGILLGAFLVNLSTTGAVPSSVGIAVGNTLEGLLGAYLVMRLANGPRVFERPPDVFKLAALAAVISPAVAATVGATSLLLTGAASWPDFSGIWLTWWLGDVGGVLIVAPMLILWGTSPLGPWPASRWIEAAAAALALVLTCLALFGGFVALSVNHYPLEFLVFPVLIWTACRFGPRETAAAVCLLSAIAIWGTLRGFGPFAREAQNESLLLVQAFIALAAVPSLVLAAAVRRLQQLHGWLEAFERERLLQGERHRIARELHDRVEQTFFGIGLTARAALHHPEYLAEPVRSSLATVLVFAEQGTEQLREAIFALNRAEVEDRGLVPSLWQLVRDFRKQARLEADLVLSGPERRVSPETAEALYAVAREALANVERHAAASAVVLSLCFESETALLTVQDDGAGVSPLVLRTLADSATHFGLRTLRQRVKGLGGTLTAQPGEDGGFVVRASVPLRETQPQ